MAAPRASAFVVCLVAVRVMAEGGSGIIIVILGIFGEMAMRSAADNRAAKHGLVELLMGTALDLQRHNLRFSLLYFGGVDTPFWERVDLRVQRDKILRPEDAGHWVAEALSPGLNGVLGELVVQPVSHQL